MLILIGLVVLIVAFWILGDFLECEELGSIFMGISAFLLLVALICLPLNRMDVKQEIRHYEALKATIVESRNTSDVSHGIERAAIITQVAEKNGWVKDMQYWNNSLFDIWIPDSVDTLSPLK